MKINPINYITLQELSSHAFESCKGCPLEGIECFSICTRANLVLILNEKKEKSKEDDGINLLIENVFRREEREEITKAIKYLRINIE